MGRPSPSIRRQLGACPRGRRLARGGQNGQYPRPGQPQVEARGQRHDGRFHQGHHPHPQAEDDGHGGQAGGQRLDGQTAQGALPRPDEYAYHVGEDEDDADLLDAEGQTEEVLDIPQVGRLPLAEEGDLAAAFVDDDADRLLVVVEVSAQLTAGAGDLVAAEAGGAGRVVLVEALLVDAALIGSKAHVRRDQDDGEPDKEEDRCEAADKPHAAPPGRPAAIQERPCLPVGRFNCRYTKYASGGRQGLACGLSFPSLRLSAIMGASRLGRVASWVHPTYAPSADCAPSSAACVVLRAVPGIAPRLTPPSRLSCWRRPTRPSRPSTRATRPSYVRNWATS